MEPRHRRLVRLGLGVVTAAAMLTLGASLLGLAAVARPGGGVTAASTTTRSVAIALGWSALAVGPVLGLRIGGLDWARAMLALPAVPVLAIVVGLVG